MCLIQNYPCVLQHTASRTRLLCFDKCIKVERDVGKSQTKELKSTRVIYGFDLPEEANAVSLVHPASQASLQLLSSSSGSWLHVSGCSKHRSASANNVSVSVGGPSAVTNLSAAGLPPGACVSSSMLIKVFGAVCY